jgi:type IX secretion system PorP/SprF family membrane protein
MGQHTPFNPISYRIFSPFIFNPAITGSKDYTSVNIIAGLEGNSNSQIITVDTRLSRNTSGYFTTPMIKEFTNFGIGGAVFNDLNGLSRNTGINASLSYHIPLDKKDLSFLSFGTSVKGVYYILSPGPSADSALVQEDKETFYPNLDFGIYYYGANYYAGISLTNLLGNPEEADSLGEYSIPVSRLYMFYGGYKLLLYRPLNIVVEPALLISTDDLSSNDINDNIEPIIRLYLQDFCLGTYFNDKNRTSFFFQYRFPRINIGAYIELPRKSAYYKKEFIMELTAGINLSKINYRFIQHSRW